MRWLAVAVVAALASVFGYWYYQPNAVPGWAKDWLPFVQISSTLYKWQDDQGQWHVGDTAPVGIRYETVEVDHSTNVIRSSGSD